MPSSNFTKLIQSFDEDALRRGKQFEKAVKYLLQNDPKHKRKYKHVWLWDEFPERTGPDIGIDLVAKGHDNSLCAIQAKCFDPGRQIPKSEIDSFISAASPRKYAHRMLVATTDGLSVNARKTLRDNHVTLVLKSSLESLESFWPETFSSLGGPRTISKYFPRTHQTQAINDVSSGLQTASRGQLIMACGTGKTLTALWITERLDSSCTLVLVPSLSLLSQTLSEWTTHANKDWDYICVCSDETVNKSDDSIVTSVNEIPAVTTKPADIAKFLKTRGRKIVFSTYQSSVQVAKAQKLAGKKFDLTIADEAHRLTGKNDAEFATVLDAKKIPTKKLLFMTATPRTYTAAIKQTASERGVEISSMDDEKVFGKELHKLSFGQAIEQDLLTDYRVVIVGVTDPQVQELIERRELVSVGGNVETDARTLAAHIGLAKAVKDYDLKKTISFHGRIKTAQAFAQDFPKIVEWMPDDHKPSGTFWADTINGAMNSSERRILLDKLKADIPNQHSLLSNARCLTEGIDVPALDAVAFIDPRSSQVDIIQAVGRAIRRSNNKTLGTIVLPVLIPHDVDVETTFEDSAFKPIWGIVNALRSHDENLVSQLDAMRTNLGRSGEFAEQCEKIIFDIPKDVLKFNLNFADALLLRTIERTTSSWDFRFGILQAYVDKFGSARVRDDLVFQSVNLGKWVGQARQDFKRRDLTPARIEKLQNLKDWSWEPYESEWNYFYEQVRELVNTKKIDLMQIISVTVSKRVREWIKRQRQIKNKGELTEDKIIKMEELQGWSWVPLLDQRFQINLELLKEYAGKYQTTKIRRSNIHQKFRVLDSWQMTLRTKMRNGGLEKSKIDALEAVPYWKWDPVLDHWDEMFELLQTYVAREGHALPKAKYVEKGQSIGSWVSTQRARYRRQNMPEVQVVKLETVPGWSWDPINDWWEESYSLLKQFVGREGHALVPHGYIESNQDLGSWVAIQRRFHKKKNITKDRVHRLEVLPGWQWTPQESNFESNSALLRQFIEQYGHSDLDSVAKVPDSLKRFVKAKRDKYANGLMSNEEKLAFEAIPTWKWSINKVDYDAIPLAAYVNYVKTTGSSIVKKGLIFEEIDLHKWITSVKTRHHRKTLSINLQQRLELIPGWDWNGNAQVWNQRFDEFVAYLKTASQIELDTGALKNREISHWTSNQRSQKRRGTLPIDRVKKLETIQSWTWTPISDQPQWNRNYRILKSVAETTGSCRVSKKINVQGVNLWHWINYQRMRYRKNELADRQISLLEKLPDWDWNPSLSPKTK